MKKLLLLTFLFVTSVFGQVPTNASRIPLTVPPVYVGSFNGTSQYFSKTSPTKMDLNGSELVANGGMEGDSSWTNLGTPTTNARSSVQAHGGTYSRYVVGSGTAGTGIASDVLTLVAGQKYTIEAWVYREAGTVTIEMADGQGSFSTTSTLNTWVKVVKNFTATANLTNRLRIYQGTADTLKAYFDDVSLTQAYDGLIVVEYKSSGFTNHGSSRNAVMGRGDAVGGQAQAWAFTYTSANLLELFISDGTNSITHAPAINLNDNRYHKIVYVLNRTGNSDLYFDGVLRATASASSLGKMGAPTTDLFVIGGDAVAARSILGSIAETAFVRYTPLPSDIASWIAYANTQRFIPEPPGGGETVLRVFGRRNDALDQSGNQGVLTNTGSTPIIQKQ